MTSLNLTMGTASLMGSGINGNIFLLQSLGAELLPLPLWEVELMETIVKCFQLHPKVDTASLMGSGINGNRHIVINF
jgi:hypothetical protein